MPINQAQTGNCEGGMQRRSLARALL